MFVIFSCFDFQQVFRAYLNHSFPPIITFIEINNFFFLLLLFFLDHSSMKNSGNWRVYAGTISQSALQIPYLVKKIIVNENYNSNSNNYDVALLKLSSPVTFSSELGFHDEIVPPKMKMHCFFLQWNHVASIKYHKYSIYGVWLYIYSIFLIFYCNISLLIPGTVQPVCFPTFDQTFSDGSECWTSGFGTTQEGAGTDIYK